MPGIAMLTTLIVTVGMATIPISIICMISTDSPIFVVVGIGCVTFHNVTLQRWQFSANLRCFHRRFVLNTALPSIIMRTTVIFIIAMCKHSNVLSIDTINMCILIIVMINIDIDTITTPVLSTSCPMQCHEWKCRSNPLLCLHICTKSPRHRVGRCHFTEIYQRNSRPFRVLPLKCRGGLLSVCCFLININ